MNMVKPFLHLLLVGSVVFGVASLVTRTSTHAATGTKIAPTPVVAVDEPGRVPFQTRVAGYNTDSCTVDPNYCQFSAGTVPAGHRLIVKQIGVSAALSPNPTWMLVQVGGNQHWVPYSLPVTASGAFGQVETLVYIDGGESIDLAFNSDGTPLTGFVQSMYIAGYMIDCTVSPCSPIAY
jgi:hypothetical protein